MLDARARGFVYVRTVHSARRHKQLDFVFEGEHIGLDGDDPSSGLAELHPREAVRLAYPALTVVFPH